MCVKLRWDSRSPMQSVLTSQALGRWKLTIGFGHHELCLEEIEMDIERAHCSEACVIPLQSES